MSQSRLAFEPLRCYTLRKLGESLSRRTMPIMSRIACILCCFSIALLPAMSAAQELSEKQKVLTNRYAQLEQILFRMSEATASSNPQQAVLLKKVLQLGKEKLVALQLGQITSVLERKQFTEAITGQESVEQDLLELLKLLESADREQKRTVDKEKIKEFLRSLEELIHQEKNLKTKTEQQDEKQITPLENDQKNVRNQAQNLNEQIAESEEGKEKTAEEKDKTADGRQQTAEEKDKTAEEKEKTADGKEKTADGKEQTAEEKEKTTDSEKQPNTPVQQAMQKAMQRMKQAEDKLKKAEKSGALEEEEEAVAELQRVKAELEKILRQLREEELLQTLEKLEQRFKRMLLVEQGIRSKTEKLGAETQDDESKKRQVQIQAAQLGADQQTVIGDADAAMVLLREDGTAQALAEALLQARFDMDEAKNRLDKAELGAITLNVEDAVISALKEMLEAVQLAIKEAEKRKERQQKNPNGAGQDGNNLEPLIQLLSELRMIRSMQQRVNDRTERYDKQVLELRSRPEADWETLRRNVDELARQQNRITKILHDIKVGKTE